ncbi:MAG: S8 family serine peptidase [Oscillospiraceae bacterium]|nr:S8 family serine peptidase [Oscillospiraceae bacterium]
MKHSIKRIVSWMIVLCMVLSFVPAADAAGVTWEKTDQKITAQLSDRLVQKDGAGERDAAELVRVSIVLDAPSTVEAGFATMGISTNARAMSYRAQLQAAQETMAKTISRKVLNGRPLNVVWHMTLVGNLISAWVPYGALEEIAAIDGIQSVAMEAQYEPAVAQRNEGAVPTAYPSGAMIGSGALWNSGYTGAGTRVAIVDTGTDTDHQSFDNGAYLHALAQNAAAKGMSLEQYKASLNLMTEQTIAKVLPELHVSERMSGITAAQLYGNEKLPFGFNYVDSSLNIVHDYDQQGEHGSHVAGIATANRYIPSGSGYEDARDAVMMLGVAPDAQLITMKVFGDGSPFDSDYMAAIEDAIMLDCDAVNLSMGTTMPGSPYTDTFNDLMELMENTDTVVVISAGNASNWPVASTFGYLYHDDVSFDTVGAPGSYANAFTVASVDNDGSVGHYFSVGNRNIFYGENTGYGNTAFAGLDVSADRSGTSYPYVFLDGLGYAEEYDGINVTDKIVFVSRGTLNFSEKANNALSRGAAAVIVYNNEPGIQGMDLTGLSYAAPVVGITQADAAAIRELSADKGTYLTGTLTVHGTPGMGTSGDVYYTMSDFSSWGVPGSLTLKHDITAPGGEIYSVWGSNAVTGGGSDMYETMSGTSMAAPQVTGMVALMAQVYRENGLAEKAGISARHLAQSLLMSTAQPLYEENSGGNYYSLMNQGAGLARVDLATQADSYIQVDGQDDYKVKAELGDDPLRTGIYSFDFAITNLENTERAYTLDADLFRQDVFEYQEGSGVWLLDTWTTPLEGKVSFSSAAMAGTSGASHDLNGDGVTDAKDADFLLEYVVGNETGLKADGDLSGDGQINSYDAHLLLASVVGDTVIVPAGGTVSIRVTMELTDAARAELDDENPKGAFVQAYVYARGVADAEGESGTVHSIPVLAFYGNWSEPSMYDRGTLMDLVYRTSSTAPYLYDVIGPYGNALAIDYGDGVEYYYGGNPVLNDETYLPERNAFNSTDASRLTEQGFTLIRGAGAARLQVTNADTGEVYFERQLGELYPAYYNPGYGQWENTNQYARLNWTGTDAAGAPLPEGTEVNVSLTAVPHYYRQPDGSYSYEGLGEGATMTTSMTIDNTAPQALNIDVSRIAQDKLTVRAKDNRHVAAVALLNANGSKILCAESPNQTELNKEVTVELDLTDIYGTNFLVAVYDYAGNMTTYKKTIDLGSPTREYFTAIDYNTMSYVGVKMDGSTSFIAETGLPLLARAAEYVGGHVFLITTDNSLCVANDEDLTVTERICKLDPMSELLMTNVSDMAYNHADGKLYVQFYSQYNYEETPYLATIDMTDGDMELVCELPVDVNTMAIDTQGNFYSAGYNDNKLYTYTLADVTAEEPAMTLVGEMGYYYSSYTTSMAWDHNEGKLYWAYPNTLVRIDHETAEPTLLGYHDGLLVGLYTRPEQDEGKFDPVNTVDRVELNLTETRIMKGSTYTLEATVWPWNASDRSVTWSSSNPAVATVDARGNVTAKTLGECVITATSKLDPAKKASCSITTFEHEKTLNGIIWDEDGYIWMSEFNTATIPAYTKLSAKSLDNNLAAATMDQNGNLYAASLDMDSLTSDLFKLDPVTFEPTLIGSCTDYYADLAPAPGQGENKLMAAYGGNILNVDATTGDYYNWYNMFSYNLVALAYVGTQPYTEWGYDTMVDWYFIIDRVGYVYLMGFLEQDGAYFYLEHDQLAPGGIYTKLDFEMETGYFGSAYFDGEMLYYSAYKESRNNVTLMAIDVAGGSKACYELGTFADNVWPVAGLMELGKYENHIDVILNTGNLQTMSKPNPVEQTELKGIREEKAQGTLNTAAAPMSTPEVKDEYVYVDVTLPYAGTNADMTVSFDTSKLELTDVSGNAAAFAWKAEGGKIRLSLADAGEISETRNVARLTFRAIGKGKTTVSIVTGGLGSEGCGHEELLNLTLLRKNPFKDVPAGAWYEEPVLWALENGITSGTSATTFNPSGACVRAQVVTFLWSSMNKPEPTIANPFKDVKESDYFYKAVLWAYEKGITAGVDSTHFGPTVKCSRAQVVTFLWSSQGKPASSVKVDFADVQPGAYYYNAVAWAAENDITSGVGDGLFGAGNTCSRAQVVTFLYKTLN